MPNLLSYTVYTNAQKFLPKWMDFISVQHWKFKGNLPWWASHLLSHYKAYDRDDLITIAHFCTPGVLVTKTKQKNKKKSGV